jgi:non-canonical purine NTP pyrophosphatase (RdgB/HAM1 family)
LKTKPRIVLATRNPNKIVEIKTLIGDLVEIETLSSHAQIDIPEFGRSLLDNSYTKAAFAYRLCGRPALADDSGLFVEALDGEPGVFSSRYGKNDETRIARLLSNLTGKKERKAAFHVVFVYYYEEGKYKVFKGECVGQIADSARGSAGFGYDPIFIPAGYKKTFAELGPAVKNKISHRARALKKFREFLVGD